MLTCQPSDSIESRTSRQITADLVNAVVAAAENDTVHQAAMLMAVIEVLAKNSGYVHRMAIAQVRWKPFAGSIRTCSMRRQDCSERAGFRKMAFTDSMSIADLLEA